MYGNGLVISSNLAEKSESTRCFVFAGSKELKCSKIGDNISGYNLMALSDMQYIDLDRTKEMSDSNNNVVDLMKVKNLDKINKMLLFEDDWNGTGGSAFSSDSISFFKTIIESLNKQPEIAPTGRGSLLMQYELDDKSLLAFEVSLDKAEKVYLPEGDFSMAQTEVFTDQIEQRIKESVELFYGFR